MFSKFLALNLTHLVQLTYFKALLHLIQISNAPTEIVKEFLQQQHKSSSIPSILKTVSVFLVALLAFIVDHIFKFTLNTFKIHFFGSAVIVKKCLLFEELWLEKGGLGKF